MVIFVAHFDISIAIEHIAGSQNTAANQLSCFDMRSFFFSNPQASWLHFPWNFCKLAPCPTSTGHHQHSHRCSALLSQRFSTFDSEVLSSRSKALPSLLQWGIDLFYRHQKPHCQCLLATLRIKVCNLHVTAGLHEEFSKQLTPQLELV